MTTAIPPLVPFKGPRAQEAHEIRENVRTRMLIRGTDAHRLNDILNKAEDAEWWIRKAYLLPETVIQQMVREVEE